MIINELIELFIYFISNHHIVKQIFSEINILAFLLQYL